MKITGICLNTIKEQRLGGDNYICDPSTVKIANPVPVTVQFNGVPIGYADVKLSDGRLVFSADIDESLALGPLRKAAIGFVGNEFIGENYEEEFIFYNSDLYEVAIVEYNKDKSIPDFEVLE